MRHFPRHHSSLTDGSVRPGPCRPPKRSQKLLTVLLASRSLGHRHCAQPRTPQQATLATAALATPQSRAVASIASRPLMLHRRRLHISPPPPALASAVAAAHQATHLLLGLAGELCDDMHQGDAEELRRRALSGRRYGLKEGAARGACWAALGGSSSRQPLIARAARPPPRA